MGNLGILLHSSLLGRNTTVSLLLMPFSAVVGFFAPWHNQRQSLSSPLLAARDNPGQSFSTKAVNRGKFNPSHPRPSQPERCAHRLRVLRVTDASCTAHSAGRMMISGRFSEVCAELDRLSQQHVA